MPGGPRPADGPSTRRYRARRAKPRFGPGFLSEASTRRPHGREPAGERSATTGRDRAFASSPKRSCRERLSETKSGRAGPEPATRVAWLDASRQITSVRVTRPRASLEPLALNVRGQGAPAFWTFQREDRDGPDLLPTLDL